MKPDAVKPDAVAAYLERRAVTGPWSLELDHDGKLSGAIVIPALAESESLPALLASLVADPSLAATGLAVVMVVNNRADAPGSEREDNRLTLQYLRSVRGTLPFRLGLVDAASPGCELPLKDGGVGMARKLGHDLVLPRLDFTGADPVIISLDADTLVEPGYAAAIVDHFRSASAGGAVIGFRHRQAEGELEERAIERYELFLRCYVAGLEWAGSPYAFQTVGSAMACRASAYLKCGGMNRRRAGEDFYFLQSLAKTAGVQKVRGTVVYPSSRRSGRVPFGTGRAVGALLDNDSDAVLFHQPQSFMLLQQWLALASEGCRQRWADLPQQSRQLSPFLHAYLEEQGFALAWERLLLHNKSVGQLCKGFHDWFDAFRTMKFFHFLAEGPYPRCEPEDLLDGFPRAWGEAGLSSASRLELLRLRENDNSYRRS